MTRTPTLRQTSLDIGLTFGRQFLAGLMQLGQVLIIARLLGPEGAGVYAVAMLLPTMLSQLFNLGINSANVYFVASRRFHLDEVWAASRDAMASMGVIGLGIGAVLILVSGNLAFPGVPQPILLLAMLIFPTSLLSGLVASLFQALQDFRAYNVTVLVQPSFSLFGIALFWLIGGFNLAGVVMVLAGSHTIALIVALSLLRRKTPLTASGADRMTYLRVALRYGMKAQLSILVTFLNYRLDLFLVNLIAGPAAAGLYAVAVRLAEQLWIISQSVSTVIFPRLSSMTKEKAVRGDFTSMMARWVLWITMISAVVLAIISLPLIVLLFGPAFQESAFALMILLPGVVLFACARVLANDFAASGCVGVNLALSVMVLVINTSANLALIPSFGMMGAAIATTLAYCMTLVAYLILQRLINNQPWTNFIVPNLQDAARMQQLISRGRR